MTRDEAQAAYDTARAKFGDACIDLADEPTWNHAKEVLGQAEKVLRGFPRSLMGVRRA